MKFIVEKVKIIMDSKANKRKIVDVVGAVIVENDKILCAQRGYGKQKGKWEFPGGKVEKDESPEDALKREIKEELDIDISVQKYLASDVFSYEDITIKLSLYLCKISSGIIHDEEHSLLKWCTKEEMKDLDWSEADKKLLIYIL